MYGNLVNREWKIIDIFAQRDLGTCTFVFDFILMSHTHAHGISKMTRLPQHEFAEVGSAGDWTQLPAKRELQEERA